MPRQSLPQKGLALVLSTMPAYCSALIPRYSNVTATGITNSSIALTGSGLTYAQACNEAKQSWLDNVSSMTVIENTPTTTETTTSTSLALTDFAVTTTLTYLSNSTAYTLCDSWPRLDGSTSVSTHEEVVTATTLYTETLTEEATSTKTLTPAPDCTIASSDCALLSSTWRSSYSLYQASLDSWEAAADANARLSTSATTGGHHTTVLSPSGSWPRSPECEQVSAPPVLTGVEVGPPSCAEAGVSVVLWYWPVLAPSGNICAKNKSTTTMSETISGRPNTIVTMSTTLTSPTAYIEIVGTWAYTFSGNATTASTGIWFSRPSNEVSSYCIGDGGAIGTPRSINYADFNYPVPAEAYRCQPKCHTASAVAIISTRTQVDASNHPITTITSVSISDLPSENWCSTIWDDYAPALSVPPELFKMSLQTIVNENITCDFQLFSDNLLFDPPRPLTQVASAAGVTTPTAIAATTTTLAPTISAAPGGSPASTSADPTTSTSQVTFTSHSILIPAALPSASRSPNSHISQSSSLIAFSTAPASAQPVSSVSQINQHTDSGGTGSVQIGAPTAAGDPSADAGSQTAPEGASQDVGGVIASVMGMQGHESSTSTTQAVRSSLQSTSMTTAHVATADPAAIIGSLLQLPPRVSSSQLTALVDSTSTVQIAGAESQHVASVLDTGAVLTGTQGEDLSVSVGLAGGVVIGSTTLAVGQKTNLAGIGEVVVQSSGISIDGSIQVYSALSPTAWSGKSAAVSGPAVSTTLVVLGISTIALPTGMTVTADEASLTVLGMTISLVSDTKSGSYTMVDDETASPATHATVASTASSFPASASTTRYLQIDGTALVAGHTSAIHVGAAEALIPGGNPVTIEDNTLSLGPGASYLVVNGITTTPEPLVTSVDLVLSLPGTTITAELDGSFQFGTAVLRPGSAVTISGETISLPSTGPVAIVDGTTQRLSSITRTLGSVSSASATTQMLGSQSVSTSVSTQSAGQSTASSSIATPTSLLATTFVLAVSLMWLTMIL
ncbi:hypothetical protein LTR86_000507 [Recurvomyces mirabilis]|nr:hypothetical protein LTR86_000507 [Recurvomyces mirabilis]